MYISASQIKAARAILGWLQDDLAKASGLAVTTIRSLETGHLSPRSLKEVHRALENAGIEFLEGEGVKRRDDQITILKGPESCNKFFEDLLRTTVNKGDEIACIMKSPNFMMESLGAANGENHDRLEALAQNATVKCLFSEIPATPFYLPPFQFRVTSGHCISPASFYVYGGKYAAVHQSMRSGVFFIIHDRVKDAAEFRSYFQLLWDNMSGPLNEQITNYQRKSKIVGRI